MIRKIGIYLSNSNAATLLHSLYDILQIPYEIAMKPKKVESPIIPTKSCSAPTQDGENLIVFCQQFVDRIFISVSQKGKIGYLVFAI